MYGCMDVWMGGCMDACVWMDVCMDGWMDVWMYVLMDVWMYVCMDVWIDGFSFNTNTYTYSQFAPFVVGNKSYCGDARNSDGHMTAHDD